MSGGWPTRGWRGYAVAGCLLALLTSVDNFIFFGHYSKCNINMYKVQKNETKSYEKLTKRCQKVVDHSEGLGGGGRGGGA